MSRAGWWQVMPAMVMALVSAAASAAEYPAPVQGDWTAPNFRFHTGKVMAGLRLHYTTIGDPKGEPVVVRHGTSGAGDSLLTPSFAGELFGPGQPLDARKYFIILPDALGAGLSAKPSDGLRMRFPAYNYDDMVQAQFRLLTEGLRLRHVRLVLGNSMGGMHTWLWGEAHPDFMDGLVAMASQPSQMSSRNWMMRRMLVESVRRDPAWAGGDDTAQPPSLAVANVFFGIATSGGTQAYQALAPTRSKADRFVDDRLAAPMTTDANDFIYLWQSSADYNPEPGLEKISAAVLAINAADDERNPPETGTMERAIKLVRSATLFVIPASADTRGHGTTGNASFWKQQLADFLAKVPRHET